MLSQNAISEDAVPKYTYRKVHEEYIFSYKINLVILQVAD